MTRSSPAVTVVVPAYRAQATIARTLRHLIAQPVARIVVVVDGPLDDTAAVAAGIGDERIEVELLPRNRGAQVARNHGLARVTTDAVLFHDADDYVEGPLLAGLIEALAGAGSGQAADIAFAPMAIERGGHRAPVFTPDYRSATDLFHRWFVERHYVIPAATLWRTDFVRAVGGWDEAIEKNQDGELVMRAVLNGARFAVSTHGLAVYVRENEGSVSRRAQRAPALLRASEKILAMPSALVGEGARRAAVASHTYRIAWDCFERGDVPLGRIALARARALGFAGHRGPLHHRLAARVLGLERKSRLVRLAKRLLRR